MQAAKIRLPIAAIASIPGSFINGDRPSVLFVREKKRLTAPRRSQRLMRRIKQRPPDTTTGMLRMHKQ